MKCILLNLDVSNTEAHCASAAFIKHSCSFEDSLHLLGLDDSSEEGTSDCVLRKGAYLSLIFLRHLKLRQLQVRQKLKTPFIGSNYYISTSFLTSLWAESYHSLPSFPPPTAYFSRVVKLPALCWEDFDLRPGRSSAAGRRAVQHSRGNGLDECSQRRTRGGRRSRLDAVHPQHSCWLQGKDCLFSLAKVSQQLVCRFQ